MRTAESVVLTLWPPGPLERNTSTWRSLSSICDLDLVGLGQHEHRRRRRVDAALALGDRHPLHPVRPALVLEAAARRRRRATTNVTSLSPPRSLGSTRQRLDLQAVAGGVAPGTSSYRSRANRLASSPPSAPRISTITLRPAWGSGGTSSSRSSSSTASSAALGCGAARPRAAARSSPVASASSSRAALGVGVERPPAAGRVDERAELVVARRHPPQLGRVGRRPRGRRGAPRGRRAPAPGRRAARRWPGVRNGAIRGVVAESDTADRGYRRRPASQQRSRVATAFAEKLSCDRSSFL